MCIHTHTHVYLLTSGVSHDWVFPPVKSSLLKANISRLCDSELFRQDAFHDRTSQKSSASRTEDIHDLLGQHTPAFCTHQYVEAKRNIFIKGKAVSLSPSHKPFRLCIYLYQ